MKIALVGNGPLAGKSTLASYLQSRYHFGIACHICTLVESFVEYENNTNYPYHEITVHEVFENKEFYRPALQDHALRVGFHDDAMLGYWIDRTVAKGMAQFDSSQLLGGTYRIVFDPIRGAKQAQYLHDAGWTVVQLEISEAERATRALAMGKNYDQIREAMKRHPEIEGGVDFADLVIQADSVTVDTSARMILNFEEYKNASNPGAVNSAIDAFRHGDYTAGN